MNPSKTETQTESERLADLASHIDAAHGDPKAWDVPGLLFDAVSPIGKLSRMLTEATRLVGEVRDVAHIIQETASPTSVIATDVRRRLQFIERQLMEWIDE